MSVINSPKSILTRGRLIQIEGGSNLQPAINLKAEARGILAADSERKLRKIFFVGDEKKVTHQLRSLEINQPILEMRHAG